MSGIVGSINTRGSGITNLGSAADGNIFTGTGAGLPVGFEAAAGGGKVLQCLGMSKTDTQSGNTNAFVDVMTLAITPTATSSKILVMASLTFAGPTGNMSHYRLARDSTGICVGDAAGSRKRVFGTMSRENAASMVNAGMTFLDPNTPGDTTTAITYKVQCIATADTQTWYVNTSSTNDDSDAYGRGASTLTLMEIGA
tara:strand:- start:36 stop:629 length:594 start_codon:yes stop_codon:yes gene_type:complete